MKQHRDEKNNSLGNDARFQRAPPESIKGGKFKKKGKVLTGYKIIL